MPLGRFTVRNEYGLGVKELYKEGVESEDPKAVLDGVAVAGLVGLLRQLGDLSQFAAEVFHGLQEQVASTVSRSRKLVTRVQHIEASLPSLEKAILSQTSHIHFAYSPGSEWHPRIKNEQNHFIIDDLPHFIMDSYEECHEPPRLQLLDRFDKGGPGSCLQRYSDPTFFRRTSASSVACNKEKSQLERKVRKVKRRRSRQRSERFSSVVPTMNNSERLQSSSQTGGGEPSLSQTGSTFNKSSISDREDQSESLGSINSTQPNKTKNKELFSTLDENMVDTSQTNHLNEHITMADKGVQDVFACHNNVPNCDVTWDEKLEIMEHMGLTYGIDDDVQHVHETDYYLRQKDIKPVSVEHVDQVDNFSDDQLMEPSGQDFLDEHGVKIDDAKNSQGDDISEITSCTELDADVHCVRTTTDERFLESTGRNYSHEQQVKPLNVLSFNDVEGSPEHGSSSESNVHGKYPTTILDWDMDSTTQKDNGIGVKDFDETNFDLHEHDSVQMYSEPIPQVANFSEGEETPHEDNLVLANIDSFPQVTEFSEGKNPPKFIVNGNLVNDSFDSMFFGGGSFDSKLRIGDVQYMLETIENDKWAMETIKPEHVGISFAQVSELSNGENSREWLSDNKLRISDGNYALENKLDNAKFEAGIIGEQYDGPVDTSTEQVNNMHLIEWPCHDDIDSETDNFVDALNTIDSESESEYETQTKTEVEPSTSECKLSGNTSTDLMIHEINQSKPEREIYSRKYHHNDGLEQSTAPLSLHNLECLESSVSSFQKQTATRQEQDAQIPPPTTSSQGIDETLTKNKVDHSTSECKLPGNASTGLMAENVNQFQSEHDFHSRMYGSNDQVFDGSEKPTSLENAVSVHQSEQATSQEPDVVPCFSQGIDETLTKEQLDPSASKNKPSGNASTDLVVENRNQLEPQHQFHSRMYDENDGVYDGSEQHTFVPSPSNLEYFENAVSLQQLAPETSQEQNVVPCFSHEQPVHSPPSFSIVSQGLDVCVNTDEIRSQPVVCKPVESSSQASQDNLSLELPFGSTNSHPRALWTNGTLFGLQPSKPTVVSMSNSAPMSSGNDSIVDQWSSKGNGPRRIMSSSVIHHGVNIDNDGQDVGSLKHVSRDGLDKKYNKSSDHEKRNMNDDLGIPGLGNGQVTIHKSKVPSSTNLKNLYSEATNTSEDRSSLLSLLGRNLLGNGIRRSASLDYNRNTSNDTAVLDLVPQSNLKSNLSSPPPSPPLEHMKISFRPIDTFETSRLKLKYPEGVDSHEITVETFPSFQLVPEPTLLQHDLGSDSDDDTFCRSYPCVSDDSVGQLSDSDSEQWESGDSSESNDHAFYDGFRQISSTESSSSHQDDTDQRNKDWVPRLSGTSQLPKVDTKNNFDLQDVTPQLPPLPPLQWRASRPVLDKAKAKQEEGSESLKRSFDNQLSESANTAKLRSGTCESDITGTQEKVAGVKVHVRKQNLPITGENTVDDRDDFLHQIRTKSFNLKRTDAAHSLYTPSLSTSNKVTAILQKASAIRKAVGSDAEDDSWSDT